MDGYVAKPFEVQILFREMAQVLSAA
jgi:hypothetical protein